MVESQVAILITNETKLTSQQDLMVMVMLINNLITLCFHKYKWLHVQVA